MFRLEQQDYGRFQKYIISNENSDTRMEFVPEHGACLLNLCLDGQSIIDGYQNPEELDANRWGKSGLLYPFPNRLKNGRYHWQGEDYEFPINDSNLGNALHGFGMNRPLKVGALELQEYQARIGMRTEYHAEHPYYPFRFLFETTYWISDKGLFHIRLKLTNIGATALPAGLGWHPYFCIGNDMESTRLMMPVTDMIGIDSRMIPTGKRYGFDDFAQAKNVGSTVLDNGFAVSTGNAETAVYLEGEKGKLRYWQETGPGKFNYLQLFTPPDRKSIAIEPMTCNVDAFNNGDGLATLAPGESLEALSGLAFEARS